MAYDFRLPKPHTEEPGYQEKDYRRSAFSSLVLKRDSAVARRRAAGRTREKNWEKRFLECQ